MKKHYLFMLLFLLSIAAKAQTAASYAFARSSGTYTSITGGSGTITTTVISTDDATLTGIGIGFSFVYCGTAYTTLSACSNGWLSLANSNSNSYSNEGGMAGAPSGGVGLLIPYWDDLHGTGVTAYYQLSGTAPNRVFTFQWGNPSAPWSTYSGTGTATFQVKIFETSNIVQFIYGSNSFAGGSATIGITNSTTDLQNLATQTASSTVTTFSAANTGVPTAGTILAWTPAGCSPPAITIGGTTSVCSGTPATLTASGATTYSWAGAGLSATTGATVTANPATITSYTVTGTTGTCSNTATVVVFIGSVVSGVKTAGTGGDFATLTAAVNELNRCGISGHVTVNVLSGTYTAPGAGYRLGSEALNASVSATSTLTIQRYGVSNPVLVAFTGTTSSDGIFKILGTDYVTIDGIDLQESSSNTTSSTRMEMGYVLVKRQSVAPFDGCQYVTIKNCTVTLNKANPGAACIYSGNHINHGTPALAITSTTDAHNNCSFLNNTLTNCNHGVYLSGYTSAASPYSLYDQNNIIEGNTISDFGGSTATAYGIYLAAQNNAAAKTNAITSATTPGTGTLYAMYLGTAVNASFTASGNTIQMTASTGILNGIVNGNATANSGIYGTGTITISGNTFKNYSFTAANSQINYLCFRNESGTTSGWALASVKMNDNVVENMALNTTSAYLFANSYCNANDVRFNNNKIRNVRLMASGSLYCYYNSGGNPTGGADSVVGNKISAVSSTGNLYCYYDYLSSVTTRNRVMMYDTVMNDTASATGFGTLYATYLGAGNNVTLSSNYFVNNYVGSSGYFYAAYSNGSNTIVASNNIIEGNTIGSFYCLFLSATASTQIDNNPVRNNTYASSGYLIYCGGGTTQNIYNNLFYNNVAGTFTYGMYLSGATTANVYNNRIGKLSSTSSGTIYLSYLNGSTLNFYDNVFDSVTIASGSIYGIYNPGVSTFNCYRNKVSYLSSNAASGTIYGMYLASGTGNIYNNLVGDLRTPASTSATGTNLVGVYATSGTQNLSYNTVVLNATTSGSTFSSSALYQSSSATLKLNNNIFINTSQQAGTGIVAAYRRNTASVPYTSTSNRNLFYAGTPGTNRVLMYNGTTGYQTLASYKAAVSPADANSYTENTTFVSLAGTGTNFLRPDPSVMTWVEGGAQNVTGITTDFYNTVRAGNTGYAGTGSLPDVGAVEGDYTSMPPCTGTPATGTAAIAPASGGAITAFALTATGYTEAPGISIQWQSSPDGAAWTNISGATSSMYSFTGISANTYFRLAVTCSGSAMTAYSAAVLATYVLTYCTPAFTYGCSVYPMNTSIASLVGASGAITDPSTTCTTDYVDNYSTMSVTLLSGTSYSATLSATASYYNSYSSQVWIDFSNDGIFQTSESVGGIALFASPTQTTTFTIPAGLSPGNRRMRITGNYIYGAGGASYPSFTPCPTSAGNNYGNARDYMVTIACNVPALTGTAVMCAGATTTLANTMTGGTWSTGDTAVATVSATGVVTGVSGGTVNVTYTLPTTCFVTKNVTVNANPAAITGASAVCDGGIITLSSTTTGGTWTSSNTAVAVAGSADGSVIGIAPGTATITYTVATGCNTTTIITVNSLPAITGAMDICEGSNITLSSSIPGGTWASSDPSTATVDASSGIVTGVVPGLFTVTYTAPTGCISSADIQNLVPEVTGSGVVCAGSTITLENGMTGGTWSSSNASVATVDATTGIVSGVAAGTATVTYMLGTGCYRTKVVTVNGLPAAITGPSSTCVGGTMTLSNATSGGTWSSVTTAVATISSDGVVTGVSVSGTTISYTLATGCASTRVITITASPGTISGTASACIAGSTTLSASGAGGGSWSSSDNSVATAGTGGVVTGVAPGMATISYTVGSCSATTPFTVNLPTTAGTVSGPSTVKVTQTITLTSTATGGVWSSGSHATVSSTGVVTGTSVGTATISYTVTGICGTAVTTATVNVIPLVDAITGTMIVCAGSSTTLSSTTEDGTWSSGNTGVATVGASTGIVTGVAAGVVYISYALTGGYAVAAVTVNGLPAVISGPASVCEGAAVTLTSTTTGGTWSSSSTNVTVGSTGEITGVSTGTAVVSYAVGTGCARTAVITVAEQPSAITGTPTVCMGTTTTLGNSVTGGHWTGGTSGNIGITGGGVVTGIAAGTASVTYMTSAGCKATIIVTVNASPASITGTAKACIGATSTLASSTPGGSWSSDDDLLATVGASTGIVTGVSAGTVLISYASGAGCYRTSVFTVNAAPAAITGATTLCVGSTTALSSATTPGVSWSSSNASVASINTTSGLATGVGAGTSVITYTLGSGCFTTTTLTVTGAPSTIGGPATGCAGADLMLTNTLPGGTWSSSNTATATIGSATGIMTGVAYGNTYITYSFGGSCYKTKLITVNSQPTVTGATGMCVGTSTTLTGSGGGTWVSSTPAIANLTSATMGYVQGVSAGAAGITFTSGSTGCYRITTVTVVTAPAASTGAPAVCISSTTTLSNAAPGGIWTSSNANASVGGTTGVVTGLNAGVVSITYSFGASCRTVKPMTVNALPAVIGGTANACMGLVTTLSDVTPGGTWSSSTPAVATVGTGASAAYGAVTGVSLGTSTISFTITSTGCARTATVTVNASPNAGTITGAIPLHTTAGGGATSVTLSSTGDAGGTWTSSNTARATVGAATGLVNAVTAGTATITYSVTLGSCTARATQLITITSPRPAAPVGQSAVNSLQLYPNPTSGAFTVMADEAGTLQVYTIDGREITQFVITSGINPLSLPKELAAGVYMCRYTSESGSTVIIRLVNEQ